MSAPLKITAIVSALFLLAACETPPDESGASGTSGGYQGQAGSGNVTPGTQSDLVTNVGDRVFFGYDSSVLSAEAQRTLDRQSAWLKQYPNVQVTMEGHADERGTREYNIALGERRASAAKRYLTAQGINPGRISVVSYGKERPAVIGSNAAAWAQNRRAVTVIAN